MSKPSYLILFAVGVACLVSACSDNGITQPAPNEAPTSQIVEETPVVNDEKAVVVNEVEEEPVVTAIEPEAVDQAAAEDVGQPLEVAVAENGNGTAALDMPESGQIEAVEMPAAEAGNREMSKETDVQQTRLTLDQQQLLASLDVKGQPPELFNQVWLNSEPLKLANLRGRVVIVEFWTFG